MKIYQYIGSGVLAILLMAGIGYQQGVSVNIAKAEETAPTESEAKAQILELTEYTQTAKLAINYEGDIVWLSSNPEVATVKDGVVTAVGNGTTTIYAVCGEKRAETQVKVNYNYTLDKTEILLKSGEKVQPSLLSADNQKMYNQLAVWSSSDEKIATVDEKGVITAISAGTATITAKAGDVTVTCIVKVETSPQESTEPTEPDKKVLKFTEYTQYAQLKIEYDGEIIWSSSNPEVATVKDGLVTAVGNGTAIISAICGEKRAETAVEVAYNYTLDKSELSLNAGEKTQLAFKSVNNQEIYNQIPVWSSSDDTIATVDKEGIITAISAGTATITAKAGNFSVTCTVTVAEVKNPEVSIKNAEIPVGATSNLTLSNYTGKVTWVSSDTKIVTVSETGTLTGIKEGTATVYAMLENGKNISVIVTVTPAKATFKLGDVTQDGEIDILDVILTNKAILGKATLSESQLKSADINQDGIPDANDSLMIMKYVVKLISDFN